MRSLYALFLAFWPLLAAAQPSGNTADIAFAGFIHQLGQSFNATQPRNALVIGNGDYTYHNLGQTPVNDAIAMRDALTAAGFKVYFFTDRDEDKMDKAISDFGKVIQQSGGVAVFYYAGHGVQYANQNFLVPIGAELSVQQDIAAHCIPVERVVSYMRGTAINLVFLDACRAYSVKTTQSFSLQQGLVQESFDDATELIVSYATRAGGLAEANGEGGLSLYTAYLVKHLRTPGLKIEEVLKNTRRDVMANSGNRQRPEYTGGINSDFIFIPAESADKTPDVTEKKVVIPSKPVEEKPTQTTPDKPIQQGNTSAPDDDFDGFPDATDLCRGKFGTANGCPDYDDDGIPDKDDDCPFVKGLRNWHGCPDTDGDTVPDNKDKCPDKPGPWADSGCPPPDDDNDGIPNSTDQCPTERGLAKFYGCPDTDGDDIPDKVDDCPNVRGERRFTGCPDTDGDGLSDKDDKCPKEKGTAALQGCPDDGFDMVRIPGGAFDMGCTSEQKDCESNETVHRVTVNTFYMGKYEVTQAQWQAIMGSNPSGFKDCDQCPVETVSWNEVQEFLKKLNNKYPGRNYRLPTEAEWEYAAREGGKAVLFGNGKNTLDPAQANFDAHEYYKKSYSVAGQYRGKTMPVGSFAPNALGLYDMAGNVWEWCQDWYGDYSKDPQNNPTGPSSGSDRVLRGGSWNYVPQGCRSAYRNYFTPGYRGNYIGFRLLRAE